MIGRQVVIEQDLLPKSDGSLTAPLPVLGYESDRDKSISVEEKRKGQPRLPLVHTPQNENSLQNPCYARIFVNS